MFRWMRWWFTSAVLLIVGVITSQNFLALIVLAVFSAIEVVSLCLEAEHRTRTALRAMSHEREPLVDVAWQEPKIGIGHFYKTDEKLRHSWRWPIRLLPLPVLWRMSLWLYFW